LERIIKEEIKMINIVNGYSENLNEDLKVLNESEKNENNFVNKNGIFPEKKFLQDLDNIINNDYKNSYSVINPDGNFIIIKYLKRIKINIKNLN
jgi:hypothetical protein